MEKQRRVIALGFFDGVHLGHGALLRKVKETADRLAAMCETLDKPVKEDAKIRQVLAECLGEYLKGAQSEEETVQKIEEELKMYLAE